MSQDSESRPTSSRLKFFGQCGPTLDLKDGFDLNEIKRADGTGAEIEFSTENLEEQISEMQLDSNKLYFEGLDKFSYMFDNGSDDEDLGKDLSWFDRMSLKMHNLTKDGGVKKLIKKEGVGIVVPEGAKIRAHYNGYLEDLDEPFDSSRLRNREMQITLGKANVIHGLDIGISSMRKNELARFLIAPAYAYGKMGCPPRIPGNATILFEVELISFTDSALLDDYEQLTDEERRDLPFERVLTVAKACNASGNEFFAQQHYGKAVRKYMSAINTLESANLQNGDQEEKVIHVCVKAYLNMALCHLRSGNFGKAIAAGKRVLEWKGEHPKALYICGKALRHLANFSSSRNYLLRAQGVAPRSKDVMVELQTLDQVQMRCAAAERDMCRKMFS